MRRKLASAIVAACALMTTTTGAAGTAVTECRVQGKAGEFVVRKVVNPDFTGMAVNVARTWPNQREISNNDNYHLFVGFWLMRASDRSGMARGLLDYSASLTPPGLNVSYEGMDYASEEVPSSNLLLDGDQGLVAHVDRLWPDTYYFIAFADGDGSFDITLRAWDITCEPVPGVTGRVVGYNALDFHGGTQVVSPGYGYAKDARLSYTNPYEQTIGAVFAYQPSPFPTPRLVANTEFGTRSYRQTIDTVAGDAKNWNWTVSYQGRTNTILIETLQFSGLWNT